MTETERKNYERYKLAYAAFIAVYPFGLEDLDGEIWEWIRGYEGLYQESTYGRTKSFQKGTVKILRPRMSSHGYLQITLFKNTTQKTYDVHRLVSEIFIPNPNNFHQVDHVFGNRLDNYVGNLEWVTPLENTRRAFKMGLAKSGVYHHHSKFTEAEIFYIRENYKPWDKEFGINALAHKFKVNPPTIYKIVHDKSYKNMK